MMKFKGIYLAVICCFMLAACGNKAQTASGNEVHKPSLGVKWKVEGTTFIIDVDTDMHISPEHYGQGRKTGEGHIHMYLDDNDKIGVTESHYEFPNVPSGDHVLKVSLHNNDHTPYDVTKTIEFKIP